MSGNAIGEITRRIAALKPGKSCFVSLQASRIGSYLASAKKVGEPSATFETEAIDGGVLVTRTR